MNGPEHHRPPAAVTPMGATADSISLRVIADSAGPAPPDDISVAVDGRQLAIDTWRKLGDEGDRLWWSSASFLGLRPSRAYDVRLLTAGEEIDRVNATTVPDSSQKAGIIFGSCYDGDQSQSRVKPIYDQLETWIGRSSGSHVNIWLGDQVYVDAPWHRGLRFTDPMEVMLGKYRVAWGLGRSGRTDGLDYAMSRGSNWYLPDDHEFWNGYPHPSFVTLPAHAVRRLAVQGWRWLWPNAPKLSHPASQGSWGRAAGEAFCVFQTDLEFDRFDESVNPAQLQRIDLGGALVVLADTRWHRSIRKTGDRARFMSEPDLQALVDLLTSEDRLVCLALSRPLIGHLPHRGTIRRKVEYAHEDYRRQYVELWCALARRAEQGRATVVLGGDLHLQSVKTALDHGLLEITSSPMAHLDALENGGVARSREVWRRVKQGVHRMMDRSARTEPGGTEYPLAQPDGSWQPKRGFSVLADQKATSGISGLTIGTSSAGQPQVDVSVIRSEGGRIDPPWTKRFTWDGAWRTVAIESRDRGEADVGRISPSEETSR